MLCFVNFFKTRYKKMYVGVDIVCVGIEIRNDSLLHIRSSRFIMEHFYWATIFIVASQWGSLKCFKFCYVPDI